MSSPELGGSATREGLFQKIGLRARAGSSPFYIPVEAEPHATTQPRSRMAKKAVLLAPPALLALTTPAAAAIPPVFSLGGLVFYSSALIGGIFVAGLTVVLGFVVYGIWKMIRDDKKMRKENKSD